METDVELSKADKKLALTNKEIYQCEECEKWFKRSEGCKFHTATPLKDTTFLCDKCIKNLEED